MGDLLKAQQKWLRRNKCEETPRKPDHKRDRKERNWYSRKGRDGGQKEKVKSNCIFCEKECDLFDMPTKRREFFYEK